ncbi:MAG: DNA polymerase III subunit gamma/tau [Bacillota bacterium]|jgi:DNA polymerase-3 subunit gamma/tau
MTYTALYRRFRPQRFGDLAGQDHISRTLKNAIKKGNFVHAYLFCGPRGTGKTSTAKILSKAVNCLDPREGEPCGDCPACLRLQAGDGMDIMEIDAASNRGIDEIRDLRERVKYAPVQEKYKVYIIDEVHMLTGEAFNALLKTLEEPPGHVMFILATTEPHKIPLTVLSRCQRFDFHRISLDDTIARLRLIAKEENIAIDEKALAMIAKKADGGLRDAVNLLDQCAGFAVEKIDRTVIATVLGSVDEEFIAKMCKSLCLGDIATVFNLIEELVNSGRDLRQFLFDLLDYLRGLLLNKLANRHDLPDWALVVSTKTVLKVIQALGETDSRLRYSLQPRISLELGLIQACNYKNLDVLSPPSANNAIVKESPPKKNNHDNVIINDDIKNHALESPLPNPAEAEAQESSPTDIVKIKENWQQILSAVKMANVGTYTFLEQGYPTDICGNKLVLEFPPLAEIHMTTICSRPAHRQVIEEKIAEICHRHLSISGRLAEEQEPSPETDLPPDTLF